jgi:chitin disaccharide deacetylase
MTFAPNAVRLVTRADDAGGCQSANEAIYESVNANAIKNVSIMACGPAFEEAVRLFADRDDIALGLHVTLNAEWDGPKWGPVLPPERVPSLLQPGTPYFTPTPKDLKEKGFAMEEAVAEVTAQLRKCQAAGLRIAYLDEHMGVGWIGLRDAFALLCAREGLLDVCAWKNLHGLPRAAETAEVTATEGSDADTLAERWLSALDAAAPGAYLLVTHPGKDAPDMRDYLHANLTPGQIAAERDRERRALCGRRFVVGCASRGIPLIRYNEV